MSKTYKATQLRTRESVRDLKPGDIVKYGKFIVNVEEIVCAMGGDFCIEGIVKSWHHEHQYDVKYGEKIFWGPKCMVRGDLYDYLSRKKLVKLKEQF